MTVCPSGNICVEGDKEFQKTDAAKKYNDNPCKLPTLSCFSHSGHDMLLNVSDWSRSVPMHLTTHFHFLCVRSQEWTRHKQSVVINCFDHLVVADNIIRQVDDDWLLLLLHKLTTVAGVKHSSVSVCASVCLTGHTITRKRMTPKYSNLVYGMTLEYPTSGMILVLKGQRSQGHKVQKHIESDRVTGVSYALYQVPSPMLLLLLLVRHGAYCLWQTRNCLDDTELVYV